MSVFINLFSINITSKFVIVIITAYKCVVIPAYKHPLLNNKIVLLCRNALLQHLIIYRIL